MPANAVSSDHAPSFCLFLSLSSPISRENSEPSGNWGLILKNFLIIFTGHAWHARELSPVFASTLWSRDHYYLQRRHRLVMSLAQVTLLQSVELGFETRTLGSITWTLNHCQGWARLSNDIHSRAISTSTPSSRKIFKLGTEIPAQYLFHAQPCTGMSSKIIGKTPS